MFLFAESLAFIVNMNEKLSSKLSPGSCFNRFICSKKSAWCSPVDRTTVLLWLAIGCYCPAYLVLLASVSLLHNSRSPCEYLHNSCSRSEGDWKSEKCASGISQEEMVRELKNQSHWAFGEMDGWEGHATGGFPSKCAEETGLACWFFSMKAGSNEVKVTNGIGSIPLANWRDLDQWEDFFRQGFWPQSPRASHRRGEPNQMVFLIIWLSRVQTLY